MVIAGFGVLSHPQGQLHHPRGAGVHQFLVQPALPDGLDNFCIVPVAGPRHLQVKPRLDGLYPVVHGAPVGHDGPLKAPLAPGHVGHQLLVVGGVGAVNLIVGAHQRPGLGLLHRLLEACQVDLPQGPLIHHRVGADPGLLLVVGQVVLHAGPHVPALDALDEPRGALAGDQRVLGEILEVPPAQGAALDVGGGAQNDPHLLRPALLPHGLADLPQQRPVKAARRGGGGREAGGGHRGVQPQVIRRPRLLAQAVGAVGEHEGLDPQPFHRLALPEVFPGAQGRFFFQRHLSHQFPRLFLQFLCHTIPLLFLF